MNNFNQGGSKLMNKCAEDEEKLILENLRFVHHCVRKLVQNSNEYEDLVSIGNIGLIKAAKTYDSSKGIKFITYAGRCIQNEIIMYFRRNKKYMDIAYLDDIITEDDIGNRLTIADIVSISDKNLEDQIIERDIIEKALDIVLNFLQPKEKFIFLSKIAGINQGKIAETINFSQSYVSRLEKKSISIIKDYLKKKNQQKGVYSITIKDYYYILEFLTDDVKQFNKSFANFIRNIASISTLSDFLVRRDKERVIIILPACSNSFYILAQIMQEIDKYIYM